MLRTPFSSTFCWTDKLLCGSLVVTFVFGVVSSSAIGQQPNSPFSQSPLLQDPLSQTPYSPFGFGQFSSNGVGSSTRVGMGLTRQRTTQFGTSGFGGMERQARLTGSTFGNSNRFAHFDKNKDGELSAEEKTAARKQLQASGFQGNRFRSQGNGGRPDISRFDTDGDQRLSETERNALRNHIRAHGFLPGHGMNWGRGVGFGGMPLYGGANGTMQRPSGAMRSRGVRRLW